MSSQRPDDIVQLTTAANPMEAHLVEQTLRSAGIRCQVVGDYLDAGIGDIPGVRPEVWVHRHDLAEAEAALAAKAPPAPDEETDEPAA